MKKRVSLAFALTFLFALTGCSDSADRKDENGSQPDYRVEQLSSLRDGLTIHGEVYVPDSEGEKPAVILSHSAGLTHTSLNSYCAGFAERGYVAYAFDFCGGSADSESDGDPLDMTIFTEVEDLKAVMKTVKELPYVDESRVFLFGTSQGGLVSALTANDCPDDVRGLMLLYPGFNIAELTQSTYADQEIPDQLPSFDGSVNGKAFAETLMEFDVYEHIGGYRGNVLILHGSNDFIVKPSYSERAAEVYESCELHVINGATHGFNSESFGKYGSLLGPFLGNYDDEAWEYLDEFLKNNG